MTATIAETIFDIDNIDKATRVERVSDINGDLTLVWEQTDKPDLELVYQRRPHGWAMQVTVVANGHKVYMENTDHMLPKKLSNIKEFWLQMEERFFNDQAYSSNKSRTDALGLIGDIFG